MTSWLNFEIPGELVGDERVTGNDYRKTYRTEILLPSKSEYEGYCFLHPSKLISFHWPLASITYNESFTFELFKKDREPGKRYKRYTLTVPELLAIYEPETAKVKAQLASKERKRLSQVGDVMALECRTNDRDYVKFVFQHDKKLYTGRGSKFPYTDEICKSRVITNGIARRQFEAAAPKLDTLCEEYRLIQDVRRSLNRSVSADAPDKTVAIYNSFYGLSDQWEEELYQSARLILDVQD